MKAQKKLHLWTVCSEAEMDRTNGIFFLYFYSTKTLDEIQYDVYRIWAQSKKTYLMAETQVDVNRYRFIQRIIKYNNVYNYGF